MNGELRSALPGREFETAFRYHLMRVWEQPPELFLESVGALPLALVSAVTDAEIPEIIRRMETTLEDIRWKKTCGWQRT